ncbi:mcfS [Symbiodinium sp. KB8]|nr:mcfS [Symbiodinium sp. KB8]
MSAHYQTQSLLSKYRGLSRPQDLSVLDVAVCASVAGMVGGLVVSPAELVKSRTQICVEGNINPYKKELKQVAALLQPGAWTKAFRGAPLIVLRDGPGTFLGGILLFVYCEVVRIRFQGEQGWTSYTEAGWGKQT